MKEKILFWISEEFTHFSIAYYLQKHTDYELYAIVDVPNRSKKFYQTQKLVNFKKVWFIHDHIRKKSKNPDIEYLKSIEKKYDLPLWNLMINERIFYGFFNFYKFSKDEILSIEEDICRLFETIFNKIKPNFFLTKEPAKHHLELLYRMALKNNVIPLVLSFTNLGYRVMLSKKTNEPDVKFDRNKIISKNRTFTDFQKFLKNENFVAQQKKYDSRLTESNINFFKAGLQYIFQNTNTNTHYHYYGKTKSKVFTYFLKSFFKRKMRKNFLDSLNSEIDFNQPFVYFPLGVSMKRTLLIDSPYFTNQLEVIRHISKSIPVNFQVFVKETQTQASRDWRPISFYKEIMKIPNVKLLSHNIPSDIILKNCLLVMTIRGSTGLEAAFYNKPSIVFSNIHYAQLPSVRLVKELDSLPKIIKEALNTNVNPSDVDRYLTFLEENTIEFDWYDFSSKYQNLMNYGGNLHDVEISEFKAKQFLETSKSIIEKLTFEHMKKLKWYKENEIN